MNAPVFKARFLAPQHWPTWLGIGILRLLAFLPVATLVALGESLGGFVGRVWKKRRHVVRTNLHLCFPSLDDAALESATDAHFRAIGAGIFEACLAWFAPDEKLAPHGTVVGLENLAKAQADGSGVLLLTGHFTTMELGARYLRMAGPPFHAMYRPAKNKVVDWCMHHWRQRKAGLPALPRDDLRGLVKALRKGHAIWYGPDQTVERQSTFVPFFGVPALTVTATARLSEMGRAKVVPYFPARIDGRYVVTVLPALDNFPTGNDEADARRINEVMEQGIAMARDQYFWVHRKFKWRPKGLPSLY